MKRICNDLYKKKISSTAVLEDVYGGIIDNSSGCMYLCNFLSFSQLLRKELIETLVFSGKREVLEKFLSKVEKVINCGGTFKVIGGEAVQKNIRYALVNEFLLWYKWWGFAADLPIYRLCFMLIYYGEKHQNRRTFENFSTSTLAMRKEIVRGLIKAGQADVLDEYCFQVQNEIRGDCYRKYLRSWGANAKNLWLKEFAMWQRLGFEFSAHSELSEAIINSFVQREDASHLATLLQGSGFIVPSGHKTILRNIVLKAPFKKEHTREMFLNVLEKYVAAS